MLSHDVLIQPLMPNRPVVALDISILLGLAGLDVLDRNTMLLSPFPQRFTDVFRAIVDPDRARLAAPFYGPVEAADDPFCGQREIYLDPQPFAVEVIQHVQKPERTAIAQAICHEIHGPGYIWRVRDRQNARLLPFQPLARLDPQVQLQLAVDPVNAFVVPRMAFDVA